MNRPPISATQAASVTVATFADPSGNAADPLFTVNWANSTVNGGRADNESGLLLQIPLTGDLFTNAWFEMDQLVITSTMIFGGAKFGETGTGQIRFYADGTNTNPVLRIDFVKGFIGKQFLGADELFYANNVAITGSAIPYVLSDEQFNFSFANVTNMPNPDDGFTGTASFTSVAGSGFSGSGSGTQEDPYIITNVYQLQEMKDDLDAWYELTNDIDASTTQNWNDGAGFLPVGNDVNTFTGHFDGKGYTITGLYINRPTTDFVGLFGYLGTNGQIKNLGTEGILIKGRNYRGGLVGYNHYGSISNCHADGSVAGSGSYGSVGGLVGYNYYGNISNCYAAGSVSGICYYVGGLVGYNDYGSISNCYANGSVSGGCGGWVGGIVGGLVGLNSGSISNCYSTDSVTGSGTGNYYVGGLVGRNYTGSISNCYANGSVNGSSSVGGLVGYNCEGSISGSFWDTQTSGQTTSDGGTGKTTAEMKQKATFTNWDFVNVWGILEGTTYPYLRNVTNPEMPVKGIDVSSWQGNIDWNDVNDAEAGYRFAFVRASWWYNGTDDRFVTNMENADANGISVGAYHFAYPEYADAGSEARHFFNVAKDYLKEGYLRPALDIENDPSSNSYPYRLGPEGLSNWVHDWMNTVKALARLELHTEVEPMLYVNRDYADFLDERLASVYDLWIAHPICNPDGEPDTKKWENWAFWQYYMPEPDGPCPDNSTGPNSVPGIDGPVDLDVFNGDMSRLNTFKISAWQPDFWILYHLCSPADMLVTDPDGLSISKEVNQIPGAAYVEIDIDGDGDLDEEISIPYKKVGYYQITIIPELNALPTDTYRLEAVIDGQTMVLAEDVTIEDIPVEPYIFESKLNPSDFDNDGNVELTDLATFCLHWLEQDCNYPDWCEGADLDYSGRVNFVDFAIFAENWLWEKIPADIDIDGDVDFVDYALFADNWLETDCEESNNWCEGTDFDHSGSVDMLDLAIFAEYWLEGI